jgi:hypothetical protein
MGDIFLNSGKIQLPPSCTPIDLCVYFVLLNLQSVYLRHAVYGERLHGIQ